MARKRLRDIIVVLPGIGGSVLHVSGEDVWAPSIGAVWPALTSRGGSFERLEVRDDDPEKEHLRDGVRATRLIPRVVVPGLMKVDGYTQVVELLANRFDAIRGDAQSIEPVNLLEFAYDWRRDNRATARKLKALIERKLPQWREFYPAAKVILIGHSMGGLAARYYLEVLGGWQDCKALITLGTPFRGSLDALGYVANGYKQMFVDLTAMLRTCPSVYQLMPIYEVVRVDGVYRRAAESTGIPHLDPDMAKQALAFHREIEAAVTRNRSDPAYNQNYKTIPFVGTMQPTLQSAVLANGALTASRALPDVVDPLLDAGDGTVPRVSAIPLELSDEYRETFYAERHSALPANAGILADLVHRLEQMQALGLGSVRGPEKDAALADRAALGVDLDDAYAAGEPIVVRAALHNARGDAAIEAEAVRLDGDAAAEPVTAKLEPDGERWTAAFDRLVPGGYRLTVRGRCGEESLPAVHDLFAVLPADAA